MYVVYRKGVINTDNIESFNIMENATGSYTLYAYGISSNDSQYRLYSGTKGECQTWLETIIGAHRGDTKVLTIQ